MRVNCIIVFHPAINESQSGAGIGYWADTDVVALEGLHERFTVAFGTFDWGETRRQVKRQGDLDRSVGGEDRAVVGQPLYRVRSADRVKPLLDALNHHVADHLAGDAGGRGDPADDLAVVAIEREGNAHDLAIPARELQRQFERIVDTRPSCSRGRRPVWRSNKRPCFFISR
jgi:hypothetical protein